MVCFIILRCSFKIYSKIKNYLKMIIYTKIFHDSVGCCTHFEAPMLGYSARVNLKIQRDPPIFLSPNDSLAKNLYTLQLNEWSKSS